MAGKGKGSDSVGTRSYHTQSFLPPKQDGKKAWSYEVLTGNPEQTGDHLRGNGKVKINIRQFRNLLKGKGKGHGATLTDDQLAEVALCAVERTQQHACLAFQAVCSYLRNASTSFSGVSTTPPACYYVPGPAHADYACIPPHFHFP